MIGNFFGFYVIIGGNERNIFKYLCGYYQGLLRDFVSMTNFQRDFGRYFRWGWAASIFSNISHRDFFVLREFS